MDNIKHYTHSAEAVGKIQELVKDTNIAMLCTNLTEMPISTCPMATQTVDDTGEIWFFSGKNSEHNHDIEKDQRVQLIYANPGSSSYLSLYGTAEIMHDKAKIDELWSGYAKVWFQDGKDDPNLTLIRFVPEDGYYWDTKNSKMVAFLKQAASLVTGKTMDDSIEGKIKM